MSSLQLFGPPEAEERRGKVARNLVVMDNKKEAWVGRTSENSEKKLKEK